jgi:hypothetical protein
MLTITKKPTTTTTFIDLEADDPFNSPLNFPPLGIHPPPPQPPSLPQRQQPQRRVRQQQQNNLKDWILKTAPTRPATPKIKQRIERQTRNTTANPISSTTTVGEEVPAHVFVQLIGLHRNMTDSINTFTFALREAAKKYAPEWVDKILVQDDEVEHQPDHEDLSEDYGQNVHSDEDDDCHITTAAAAATKKQAYNDASLSSDNDSCVVDDDEPLSYDTDFDGNEEDEKLIPRHLSLSSSSDEEVHPTQQQRSTQNRRNTIINEDDNDSVILDDDACD